MGKKHYLDFDWDIKYAKKLVDVFAQLKTKEGFKKFLADILTVKELKEVIRRLGIAELLSQGKTYEEIRKELHVTPTTINRVNMKLKHGKGGYKLIFKQK